MEDFYGCICDSSPSSPSGCDLWAIKTLEERCNSSNEWENGDAGLRGGGGGGGHEPKTGGGAVPPRQLGGGGSGIYFCCGKTRNRARDCSMRKKTSNIYKAKGYPANMCKKSYSGVAVGAARGGSDFGKPLVPAIKPKLLNFAKGTRKNAAKEAKFFHALFKNDFQVRSVQ